MFKRQQKPLPLSIKITAVVFGCAIIGFPIASFIVPKLNDPAQSLSQAAKKVESGPKNPEDAKQIKNRFNNALREYLMQIGSTSNANIAKMLQKVLPSSAFEVHVVDLSHGMKVVEVDTILQGCNYLVMNNKESALKVFPLTGLEVFDDARIIKDSAGSMLVALGHADGPPPHFPEVKLYALLPDEILDESDKFLPPIKGEGWAKFTRNGRDIVLDLSLLSLGQSEQLFANSDQHEDGTVHQYLEWKDAHYISRYEYGSSPFATLYAVARCLRYPELISAHKAYLGSAGEHLVKDKKSPKAADFKVEKLSENGNKITYAMHSNIGNFEIIVKKIGNFWSVVAVSENGPAASSTAKANNTATNNTVAKNVTPQPDNLAVSAGNTSAQNTAPIVEATKNKESKSKADSIAAAKSTASKSVDTTDGDPVEEPKGAAPIIVHAPGASVAQISQSLSNPTVNMRSGPSIGSKTLATPGRGAPVQILGKQNGWYRVSFQGKEGFVYGGFLNYKKSDAYTTAVVRKSKTISDGKHNLGTTKPGDRLVILGGIHDNKYKLQLPNGKVGFVDKDAIDVSIEAPPNVP